MKGFFKKTIKEKNPPLFDEITMLPSIPNCKKCGLDQTVISPRMDYTGKGKRGIFILGSAPGSNADRANIPFIADGKAGQLLSYTARLYGIDIQKDAWVQNAVNCRPTTTTEKGFTYTREPNGAEIRHCRPLWWKSIQDLKPKFIWLLGEHAVEAFFGNRRNQVFTQDLSISRWHRLCIPDPVTNAWVIPLYNPGYSYFSNARNHFYFEQEFHYAVQQLERPVVQFSDETEGVALLSDINAVASLLVALKTQKLPFSHDYETNCLRPWIPGAKVASIGISLDGKTSWAFPYDYPGAWTAEEKEIIKELWRNLLLDNEVPKIVQSYQMEGAWAKGYFDAEIANFHWDTMIASHVEDERDKFTGLKMQAYIHWGILGYDDDVKHLLKGDPLNRVFEIPLNKLLLYNGMDAKITQRLYFRQEQQVLMAGSKLREVAYKLFHEGVVTSANMEERGIPINLEHYNKTTLSLSKRQNAIEDNLLNQNVSLIFQEKYKRLPNLASPDDLKIIFFDLMGRKPTKYTDKHNISVDIEALESMDNPFANKLLNGRKLKKIQDYILQFLNLQVGGYLHPNFNLHTVKTYRSSSSNPNFQNIPKRAEEAERLIRMGIIPSLGNFILEVDYGSMEVRIICCCSKDVVLAEELNKGIDIHQYWTDYLSDYGVTRYDVKNGVVFPLFYGSWFENIHKDLVSRGYKIPVGKIEELELAFWKKFHYTYEYREKQMSDYQRKGYVETLTGFKRHGFLRKTQIINTPVQAAAFHCLQWSVNKLDRIAIKELWRSVFRGQIHDAIFVDQNPEEFLYTKEVIERVMTKDIREEYSWIIVPLLAEMDRSEIDGNWLEMKKVDSF